MARDDENGWKNGGAMSRRTLVGAIAAVAAARGALAQAERGAPPSVVTSPPRDFGPNAPPNVYVFDPDIVVVDPLFTQYVQGNTPIQRLWTGALWSEGPAWSGQGRYLVWSDIPNNRQLRWLEIPARSASSACRRTTAMATPSTSRAARSRASI